MTIPVGVAVQDAEDRPTFPERFGSIEDARVFCHTKNTSVAVSLPASPRGRFVSGNQPLTTLSVAFVGNRSGG